MVDWLYLGDEDKARQKCESNGGWKRKSLRISEYKTAVRANRRLSVVLRDQELNEDAARFAYRGRSALVSAPALVWETLTFTLP